MIVEIGSTGLQGRATKNSDGGRSQKHSVACNKKDSFILFYRHIHAEDSREGIVVARVCCYCVIGVSVYIACKYINIYYVPQLCIHLVCRRFKII